MTAKELISRGRMLDKDSSLRTVDGEMHLLEVLPLLLDSPGRELGVSDRGVSLGVIDQASMLEGLGRMIAPRDDCSVITIECRPEDYSASLLAHAVEDSDAHLVDLFSTPTSDGKIKVTLRVRNTDPMSAVHSLERYDFHVVDAHAAGGHADSDNDRLMERLMSLQTLLNV